MLAEEIFALSEWMERYVLGSSSQFESFCSTLENNARQPSKQPVKPHYDDLVLRLEEMPVEQLSAEQRSLLERRGVFQFLGAHSVPLFSKIKEQDGYDPATAAQEARGAWQKLQTLSNELIQVRGGLFALGVNHDGYELDKTRFTTRIRFAGDASIANMADFKRWANDWHVIAHGIAAAAGERPEDVEVVGASRGSLIIWISTSLVVAGALAVLARNATSITLSVVQALNAIEQLRHTKVMNQQIEEIAKENVRKLRDDGKSEIVDGVVEKLGGHVNAELKGKLEKAVDKYLEFSQRGGEIDMLAPPAAPANEDGEPMSEQVAELRNIIEETRKIRDEMPKLIEGFEGLG
jgi:hypothetical protein